MKTKNLAVMFTDIKGFTEKTSRKSRSEIKEMLKRHNESVLPVVARFGGRLVKTIGDAFLVTFESSTDAVLCGVAVQNALAELNKGRAKDDTIDIRIAINAGEVSVAEDGDIFGDAVNIASRIEGIAEAGEVFFTEAVYLSMNKNEVPSSEIGYRQFKGIADRIKVYKVLKEDPVKPRSAADSACADEPSADEVRAGGAKEKDTGSEGASFSGVGGIAGKIMDAFKKAGMMRDVDMEDGFGKKVRINDDGIHVVKDGKEIRIDKDGIRIRRVKDGEGRD